MIQATEPLVSPFLRLKPTDWEHRYLAPLTNTESEIMRMVSRVLAIGWGPYDPLRGRRLSVALRPARMQGHGGRRSERTYQRAINRLVELEFLEITHTDGRGTRSVRPSQLWRTRQMAGSWRGEVSPNHNGNHRLSPLANHTVDVKKQSSAQRAAVSTKTSDETPPNRPLKFKTGETPKDQTEFRSIVGRLWVQSGKNRQVYGQANALLRQHRVTFLLPIYREATSPTAGIANPGGWVRVVVNRKTRE